MEFLKKTSILCPIPEEQKPIIEYLNRKKNNSFEFLLKKNEKIKLLGFILFLFFHFFFYSSIWISINFFLISFFILRNYLNWKQIYSRFSNSKLFYEEASWYDGQFWEKPFSIIKTDQLIGNQQIYAFLKKRKKLLILILFFSLILFFLSFF